MIMDPDLDKFILDSSTPEDQVMVDLYRQTHLRFVNPNMVCGYVQGKLLEFLTRMINPSVVLEIGTFTGYSAIYLARGSGQGCRVITIESNDELFDFANSYFVKAGMERKISQITGRAQDIIPGLNEVFDLVYIDGDKREYSEYYNLVFEKVRPGGFIIADNVIWGGKAIINGPGDTQSDGIKEFNEMIGKQENVESLILPLRDGLMLIRKKW